MDTEALRIRVIEALQQIFDPEIPANIYDLGLIYNIDIQNNGAVTIQMTLTSPNCPVAQTFPSMVEEKIAIVEGVADVKVELVWDPPWTMEKMKEEIRLELGLL